MESSLVDEQRTLKAQNDEEYYQLWGGRDF